MSEINDVTEQRLRDLNIRGFSVRRIDGDWECSVNVGRGVEPPVRGATFILAILAALEKLK